MNASIPLIQPEKFKAIAAQPEMKAACMLEIIESLA